jgi:hypothetical protein
MFLLKIKKSRKSFAKKAFWGEAAKSGIGS